MTQAEQEWYDYGTAIQTYINNGCTGTPPEPPESPIGELGQQGSN